MGNSYFLEELEGKNLLIIAGGFAVTTLRSTIVWLLDPAHRSKYGKITFIYGARPPGLLLYKEEWQAWLKRDDLDCYITADREFPGLDRQGGLCARRNRRSLPAPRKHLRLGVWAAHHDQIHPMRRSRSW